jgi:putative transposase
MNGKSHLKPGRLAETGEAIRSRLIADIASCAFRIVESHASTSSRRGEKGAQPPPIPPYTTPYHAITKYNAHPPSHTLTGIHFLNNLGTSFGQRLRFVRSSAHLSLTKSVFGSIIISVIVRPLLRRPDEGIPAPISRQAVPPAVLPVQSRSRRWLGPVLILAGALVCWIAAAWLYHATRPHFSHGTVEFPGQPPRAFAHPYLQKKAPKAKFLLREEIDLPDLHPTVFEFYPQDVLWTLRVNGHAISATGLPLSAAHHEGRSIDLAPYLHPGVNELELNMEVFWGEAALRLQISPWDKISLALSVLVTLAMTGTVAFVCSLRRIAFLTLETVLLLGGILLRFIYMLGTPYFIRAYDFWGHADYLDRVPCNWSGLSVRFQPERLGTEHETERHTTEEIIRILREADQGKSTEAICREHNVTTTSYYRWKKKYGGMELQDARRYRELEKENCELKKIVADQMLKIRVLEEVNSKKW